MSDSPISQFEVDSSKWYCCNQNRKSEFCPDCGKRRPEKKWSSRIEDIIFGWEDEIRVSEKTAATIRDKMTALEVGLERLSRVKSWKQLEEIRSELSLYCSHLSEREGLKVSISEVENDAKRRFSEWSGRRDAHLRKSASRKYWVQTVNELLGLIPRPGG